jgi:peroxiredoxin
MAGVYNRPGPLVPGPHAPPMPLRRGFAPALVVLVFILLVVSIRGLRERPFRAGEPAPPLVFTDLEERTVSLASLEGRVVVLNYWATWCAPCLTELPSLDRLHRALSREGLVVLAVSVDEGGTDVEGFVRERGFAFTVLRDRGGAQAARELGVDSYPTTFVIDRALRLREHYLGIADWDRPEALDHFRGFLSESTSPTR